MNSQEKLENFLQQSQLDNNHSKHGSQTQYTALFNVPDLTTGTISGFEDWTGLLDFHFNTSLAPSSTGQGRRVTRGGARFQTVNMLMHTFTGLPTLCNMMHNGEKFDSLSIVTIVTSQGKNVIDMQIDLLGVLVTSVDMYRRNNLVAVAYDQIDMTVNEIGTEGDMPGSIAWSCNIPEAFSE